MTAGQTGENDYETRLRRAELLSSPYSGATEFLVFFRHIASFQKFLHANIAAANQFKPTGGLTTSGRDELDLTVLLPHFRSYLSVVEQHAPSALAESARQMALLTSDAWIASLDAYWKHAGIYDQQVGAFAQFLPRAFLEPYTEFRGRLTFRPPPLGAPRLCPVCGSRPLLGVLRQEGDGGKRFLVCSFCLQEWEFRRILCPMCGEEAEEKLPIYVADDTPHVRVEACDTCKFYLRTIDLTKDGRAVPLVDDLAAIPHSLWAHQQTYTRVQPNLLGT